MKLNLGDVLEWAAGACAVIVPIDATGKSWPGWLVAAVFLAYEAQCYGSHSITFAVPKLTAIRTAYRRLLEREAARRAAREQS
jgi:hypothetical protein